MSEESLQAKPLRSSGVLIGLVAGIATGVFLGQLCEPLGVVADGFVALLQMTVLPYIVVSLIGSLGRLTLRQSRKLAAVGGAVLLVLWTIALLTVVVVSLVFFSSRQSAAFFSTATFDPPKQINLVEMFVPANIFHALANNVVPAVVTFCIFVGVALIGSPNKQAAIDLLDFWSAVLARVNRTIARLTPLGVFFISAHAAGTMSFAELKSLQLYLAIYTFAALLLTFVALPLFVSACTPFRYREVLAVTQNAMVTAFATGKLVLTLPLLIEQTERLFASRKESLAGLGDGRLPPSVDVLYPLAYPFPHLGKLLSLLFIPFAAWFLGTPMSVDEYPQFLVIGLTSYFAGPVAATTFLLEFTHLPHDMFQLFLVGSLICGRLGDALGGMHLAAFTLLTGSVLAGWFEFNRLRFVRFLFVTSVMGAAVFAVLHLGLGYSMRFVATKEEVLAHLRLLESPVEFVTLDSPVPNPDPLRPGETLLERVRRRGVLRVGFCDDKLPFAYYDAQRQLVGFDIMMAHLLARDLNVRLEFVSFERTTLAQQIRADHFDVAMSGLHGTIERAESLLHTEPYLDVTLALVVPDYRARSFRSLQEMRKIDRLKIGFVDISGPFAARLHELLPNAELVAMNSNQQFFETSSASVDALLISAESGAVFTLLYPSFEVVIPEGRRVAIPLFYVVGAQDTDMRDFLDYWVMLKRKDGSLQEQFDHWILGRDPHGKPPRWSIVRDVLGWVK